MGVTARAASSATPSTARVPLPCPMADTRTDPVAAEAGAHQSDAI